MNPKDLTIDPHNLDGELMLQPVLFANGCQAVEDATRSRDTAKHDLDNILSTTQVAIRTSKPSDYGVEKFTEAVITALVDKDEFVIKAKSFFSTCQLHTESRKNDLRAIEMKKKAIEGLIQLFMAEYFAIPKMGKMVEGGKHFEDLVQESATAEHRENLSTAKEKRRRKTIDPPTSQEERDEKTDEEKIAGMSEKGKAALEEVLEDGKEKPRKRRQRKKRS